MSNELRDKIYDMSNHFLPLDMFYNDIENMAKYPSFNQSSAFKDLEKIADFVLDLQSQLAEKDKEIKYYESEWKGCQQDLDHYKGECFNLQDEQNQKAIEQLEKVKENIHYLLSFDYNLLCKVNEQFDNQIKQLKEKK